MGRPHKRQGIAHKLTADLEAETPLRGMSVDGEYFPDHFVTSRRERLQPDTQHVASAELSLPLIDAPAACVFDADRRERRLDIFRECQRHGARCGCNGAAYRRAGAIEHCMR